MCVFSFYEKGKRREEASKQTLGQRTSGISNKVVLQDFQISLAHERGSSAKATLQLTIGVEAQSLWLWKRLLFLHMYIFEVIYEYYKRLKYYLTYFSYTELHILRS